MVAAAGPVLLLRQWLLSLSCLIAVVVYAGVSTQQLLMTNSLLQRIIPATTR